MKHQLLALILAGVAAPAAAATLLKGDIPAAERVQRLRLFFQPQPGQPVALDAAEVRDFRRSVVPDRLRGAVTVSPPKGVCLRITRDEDQPDEVVCRKTKLSFRFSDLNSAGRLIWQVKTGEGDFGTTLQWPSPYRLGSVIPFGIDAVKDPPQHVYLSSCKAERGPTGRRISLGLLSGETWIIHLPEVDQRVTKDDDPANLDVDYIGSKQGIKGAEAPAEASKGHEGKGEEAKAEEGKKEGEAAPKTVDPVDDPREDRKTWAIPARLALVMPADRFQPHGSVTRGIRGQCRYIYQGPADDPRTGRLECHNVDGFQQVYLPLTCLGELAGKEP